jgi:hypothetical protein
MMLPQTAVIDDYHPSIQEEHGMYAQTDDAETEIRAPLPEV